MKSKISSALVLVCVFLVLVLGIRSLLQRSLDGKVKMQEVEEAKFFKYQMYLDNQTSYETKWKNLRPYLISAQNAEESLNQWMKSLFAYAESKHIVFQKAEPRTVKRKGEISQIKATFVFKGLISDLIQLLYFLIEKDPLTKVSELKIEKDKDGKSLLIYLTLTKEVMRK